MVDEHIQTSSLEQELSACTTQLADLTRRYTYLSADFDTYRRRMDRERLSWMQESEARIIKAILPVVDDFERAHEDLKNGQFHGDLELQIKGFELVHKAFKKMLTDCGVEEIGASGEFDPTYHEALMHVSESGKAAGAIVAVLQKGYSHRGAVLRPARVSVAA